MRSLFRWVMSALGTSLLTLGCSTAHGHLRPPADFSRETVKRDMLDAFGAAAQNTSTLDQAGLLDKWPDINPPRFFWHGRFVVCEEGYPAMHKSLLGALHMENPSDTICKRYVLALLLKGYVWEFNTK